MMVLPGNTLLEDSMEGMSVTSKGQVTIPRGVRQRLEIRQGSRVEFLLIEDRVELRVKSLPSQIEGGGFGMLKSRRKPVPADFDPATLLAR